MRCPYCSARPSRLDTHIDDAHAEHAHRTSHDLPEYPRVAPSRALRHLRALYGRRCLACGRSEPDIRLTVDHVIPLSYGGTNTLDNYQPLCKECNEAKGARIVDYRGSASAIG